MGDIIIGVEANGRNIYIFIGYVIEVGKEIFAFIGVQISADTSERCLFVGFGFPLDDALVTEEDPIPNRMSAFIKLKISNVGTDVYMAVEQRIATNACYIGLHKHHSVSCFFGLFHIISIE